MSWNNVGPVTTLESGGAVTWTYWFPNNQDMGVQLAGPNTGNFASPIDLGTAVASNQGKQVVGISMVNYVVTITNVAPPSNPYGGGGVTYNLQGGGVS
jgi:hypothetical protein